MKWCARWNGREVRKMKKKQLVMHIQWMYAPNITQNENWKANPVICNESYMLHARHLSAGTAQCSFFADFCCWGEIGGRSSDLPEDLLLRLPCKVLTWETLFELAQKVMKIYTTTAVISLQLFGNLISFDVISTKSGKWTMMTLRLSLVGSSSSRRLKQFWETRRILLLLWYIGC